MPQKNAQQLDAIRHSLAHLLAAAVLKKFPKAKLGIGPVIENGFYYDFLLSQPINEEDFGELEKSMRGMIHANLTFSGKEVTPAVAKKQFKDQPFKLELISEFTKEKKHLTVYATGAIFSDLCRGGHVKNTKEINPDAFKLTKIAGAYWRGDEKNKQLQRIYGVAFQTKKELDAHLAALEEAKKRDHRKLGKEMGLFTIIDEIGPGLPLFYPKGALLRRAIENFIQDLQEKKGYEPIWIPHITKGTLYKQSGHLEKYDALYPPMKLRGETDYYLKPMNCPHFMMLYKSAPRSQRDLPIRWTSTTTNYRYEKSGELTGLTRVRALTQDDCHVFCTSDQIPQIINEMLDMVEEVYGAFGFNNFWVRISTHDPKKKEKYIGDEKIWKLSEKTLEELITKRGWKHEIGVGEGAFYGPKLDFIFKDALGRDWQLSTIQLDMNLPQRFQLEYAPTGESITQKSTAKAEPVVIHRAILGSTERFLGILIEHYAGAFPLWLAPVQVGIIPVSEKLKNYATQLQEKLKEQGIRVAVKDANETLGKRIREAELEKIPYLFIIGEREENNRSVSVRHPLPFKERMGERYKEGEASIEEILSRLKKEVVEKGL
jgi:threonyl-tRNA synthetase